MANNQLSYFHSDSVRHVHTNIRALLQRLSRNLGTIKEVIKIENKASDFGLNTLMETRILKVYNLSTGLNFENVNLLERNYPGIDGVEQQKKIMVQVTSTFENEKIEDTIRKIIEHRIYEKYNRLQFIFLKDKKKLSKAFESKLQKIIGGRFQFLPQEDLIDLNDIFRLHQYSQDFEKVYGVVHLLDEVLNYLPPFNHSGYDALGVCFHEEEIDNVYRLVDIIIRERINVYITSKKLYDRFRTQNHPFHDLIILVHPTLPLTHVTFCITVLSNAYIHQLLNRSSSNGDPLFAYAQENEIKMEHISFDTHLSEYRLIHDKIKSYRSMHQNLAQGVKEILSNRLKASAYGNISMEEIKQELINTHNNFTAKLVREESDYILLNLKMQDLGDIELNYLVLAKDFILQQLVEKLQVVFKTHVPKNLNILVPKNFEQKTRRRLEGVKTAFNCQRVYYVDEHLFDKRFKSLCQNSILSTNEFVSPVIKHNDAQLRINDIIYWIFNNSDSSVAILNGSGGIGKTTVCQKIHDIIVNNNERTIVIFIDADRYIEVFGKKANNGETEYDIYNIFSACHPHANIIDKNSFFLNYSLGNIIIIFDGIDEIISTIPAFNLFKFLDTLEHLRVRLGKGKILINCRDAYITDVQKFYSVQPDNKIQIYELLGFSEELARKFFLKHFNDEDMVRSCIKLVKEFFPEEKDTIFKYPPFILEIVIQLVGSDFEYEDVDIDFHSKILQANEQSDIVIYRICNREFIKKEKRGFQLDIDQQVRFLCELAIEEKGTIKREDFVRLLQQIGIEDRVDEVAKGLADHPLLLKSDDIYGFRFDFFNMYFKAIAIFNMLATDIPIPLTERLINILAYDCNYNSVISKTILNKAKDCKIPFSHCLKYSKLVIRKIMQYDQDSSPVTINRNKKAISNILVLILASRYPSFTNEYIINDLFGENKNEISHFYLIDVPQYAGIEFDFSGFYFSHSEINNYGSFFQCKFNEDTYFDETCTISNVSLTKVNWKTVTADLKHFDKKIKGDNSIFRVMTIKNSSDHEIKRYFRDYLESFYVSNQFYAERPEKMVGILQDEMVTMQLLTRILKANGIIVKHEQGIFYLDERLKFRIIKFLTQGIPFPQLNRCVVQLKTIMLAGDGDGKPL